MSKIYGLCYQGSKGQIADFVKDAILPCGLFDERKTYTHFYDVFGGGCAITHYILENTNIPHVYTNDLSLSAIVFKWLIENVDTLDFDKLVVPNRERFLKERLVQNENIESWIYVNLHSFCSNMWEFGYNINGYLLEQNKRLLELIYFNNPLPFKEYFGEAPVLKYDMPSRVIQYNEWIKSRLKTYLRLHNTITEESLLRAEQLGRMNRMLNLSKLKEQNNRLEVSKCDYRDLHIEDNSLVYLDPPYNATRGYYRQIRTDEHHTHKFNNTEFIKWAEELSKRCDVYVSELNAPKHWVECKAKPKTYVIGNGRPCVLEKVFKVVKE